MYHIIFSFIFHKIFLSVAQSDFHPVTLCLEVCVWVKGMKEELERVVKLASYFWQPYAVVPNNEREKWFHCSMRKFYFKLEKREQFVLVFHEVNIDHSFSPVCWSDWSARLLVCLFVMWPCESNCLCARWWGCWSHLTIIKWQMFFLTTRCCCLASDWHPSGYFI